MKTTLLQSIRNHWATRVVIGVLALLLALPSAWANNLMVRLPVLAFEHGPQTQTFDFGTAAVGSQLSTVLRFTNRSSKPTTMGAVTASGRAVVQNNDCVGTLEPYESCDVQVGFQVAVLGSNTGSISINHSEGKQPDVFQLTAKGVSLSAQLRFDESLVNFGAVPIQSAHRAYRSATLRNTGEETAHIDDIRLSAPSSVFKVEGHNCAELAPGATCQVQLSYGPLYTGNHTIGLRYTLETGESPVTATTLSGQGVAGKPTLSTTQLNFENGQVGQESAPQELVVTNSGNGELLIDDIQILDSTGQASPYFRVKSSSCTPALAAGASCSFFVTYTPPDDTVRSASARLLFKQSLTQQLSTQLWAKPAPQVAQLQLQPSSVDFGSVGVGQSATQTLKIRSVGTKAVNVSGYTIKGANAADFTVLNAADCTGSLTPGMECNLQLRFTAGAGGTRSAALSVASTSAAPVADAVLTGQGALGILSAQPASLSFANVEVGTSATQAVQLRNQGPSAITIKSLSFASAGVPFTVSNGCTGVTLSVNQTCTVNVTFTPTSANSVSSLLNVAHTGEGGNLGLSLTGTALPAKEGKLTISPIPVNLGSVPIFSTQTAILTIASTGTKAVNITGLSISGADASEFTLNNAGNCMKSLAPNASCTVTVSFRPTAAGPRNAQINITSDAAQTVAPVALTGTGMTGTLAAEPASVTFAATTVGGSKTTSVIIRNKGTAPVYIQSVSLVNGTNVFTAYASNCIAVQVPAGSSCRIDVAFAPTNAQSYTGSLRVVHNGSGGNLDVPLSGLGSPAPEPKVGPLALSCPAVVGVSEFFSCNARIESVGEVALRTDTITYRLIDQKTGSVVANFSFPSQLSCLPGTTTTGGAGKLTISPGGYCDVKLNTSITTPGNYKIEMNVTGNVNFPAVSSIVSAQEASLSLQVSDHPRTQPGSSSSAQHTLTNTSPFPVALSQIRTSNSQFTINAGTCVNTLNPGASCTFSTTCNVGTGSTQELSTVLTANTTPANSASTTVRCPVGSIDVAVTYAGTVINEAGAYTASGNWVRLTNNGDGPVTISGLYPATGWALLASASTPDSCTNGKVLQKGQSCLVLEHLNGTQAPGATISGTQRVRVTSGAASKDITWNAQPITVKGLVFTPLEPFGALTVNVPGKARYELTNQAPVALALPLSFNTSTSALQVTSHNCPSTLAARAKCTVELSYSGTSAGTFNISLTARSGYPALVGGQPQSGTPSAANLGSANILVTLEQARLIIEAGTNNPAINPGQSATITHVLRNESKTAVQITGSPTLSNTTQYQLAGGTCAAGLNLAPNSTCTILVRFAPPANATYAAQSTISVPTQARTVTASFTGNLVSVGDISVTLSGPSTSLAGNTNNYTLTVRNSSSTTVTTQVRIGRTNQSGSTASLSAFSGGACGAYSINSGSVLTQSVPTANASVGCSPQIYANSDSILNLTLAANATYTGTLTFNAGSSAGTYVISASASGYNIHDTNSSNDASSVSTTVTLPAFDLSVTATLSQTTAYAVDMNGSATFTVRRHDSYPGAVNATLNLSQNSVSGGANVTVTGVECASVSTGATCATNGSMSLPPGGQVSIKVNFRTSTNPGTLNATATVVGSAAGMTETNTSNNTTSLPIKIRRKLYFNFCYFSSNRTTNYSSAVGNPPHYANSISLDKWLRQHVADVTITQPGSANYNASAYRMYNPETGEQDGAYVGFAIKGTNIGMLPGTAVVDIRTGSGWGGSPAGYGPLMTCYGGTKPENIHPQCRLANGYRIVVEYGNSYGVWFAQQPVGSNVTVQSSATGAQLRVSDNPSGEYRLMWAEFTPYNYCLVPGSSTYRSTAY